MKYETVIFNIPDHMHHGTWTSTCTCSKLITAPEQTKSDNSFINYLFFCQLYQSVFLVKFLRYHIGDLITYLVLNTTSFHTREINLKKRVGVVTFQVGEVNLKYTRKKKRIMEYLTSLRIYESVNYI